LEFERNSIIKIKIIM